ncbi:hypothetical protein AB0A71_39720 [Kitasatospora aureofaciens]|uniref:hypothetical protein n=1 Tax=Kitasatospora aureofaciens TaxID=1894 RepID=UPI0033E0050E
MTARLGVDESADTVNAVRTMLERLTKGGRAQRPGRGLYARLDGFPAGPAGGGFATLPSPHRRLVERHRRVRHPDYRVIAVPV